MDIGLEDRTPPFTRGNPDFVEYAESYGATGHQVLVTEQLVPPLESALCMGGVYIVNIPLWTTAETSTCWSAFRKDRMPFAGRRRHLVDDAGDASGKPVVRDMPEHSTRPASLRVVAAAAPVNVTIGK